MNCCLDGAHLPRNGSHSAVFAAVRLDKTVSWAERAVEFQDLWSRHLWRPLSRRRDWFEREGLKCLFVIAELKTKECVARRQAASHL
jgi:hypothetical protein